MTIPDYQTLMSPLLRHIAKAKVDVSIGEVVDAIADELELSTEDRSALIPSGGQTLLMNRLHWAKSYLARAGALESTKRGRFRITDRGKVILQQNSEQIDNVVLRQFPEFTARLSKSGKTVVPVGKTAPPISEASPEDQIVEGYNKILEELSGDLLERIHAEPPIFFERLIVDLLVAMGYGGGKAEAGKALGKSGDGGVDGVINEDALGLDVVYLQAKRYAPDATVPVSHVRDFVGSLEGFRASKGVFVTTSSFPASAREFAGKVSKRIVLIDGEELSRLLIKFNIGVRTKDTYAVKALDEDYFAE